MVGRREKVRMPKKMDYRTVFTDFTTDIKVDIRYFYTFFNGIG